MTPESSPPAGSLPPVPAFDYAAQLIPLARLRSDDPAPTAWFITHPLGGPAAGTYTEVVFTDYALGDLVHATPAEVRELLAAVVRRVAVDLYGTAWAFTYPPERYDDAIARHGTRRRERVLVTRINVYTDTREDPRP